MKLLRACGLIAGPLFVVVFLIEGALKPDYDPLRHPVSSLALGPWGWTQAANFIVCGLLTVAFAVGLGLSPGVRDKVGAVLVAIWGLDLIGAGLFVTDPISGYPPGTPAVPDPATATGELHDWISLAAFLGIALAFFVMAGGRGRLWMVYSLLTAVVFLVAFVLAGIGFTQDPDFVQTGGLWQRISITAGWLWLTLLAGKRDLSSDR